MTEECRASALPVVVLSFVSSSSHPPLDMVKQ